LLGKGRREEWGRFLDERIDIEGGLVDVKVC